MTRKNHPAPNHTISQVKEQFKNWRRTRKSSRPIPEKLWEAAESLSSNHSISQISRELVLDYSSLKKRVLNKKKHTGSKMAPPRFIELELEPQAVLSECIVEMEDSLGAKMRIHVKGKADFNLLETVKTFWRKEP